jgi:hypothetical protein
MLNLPSYLRRSWNGTIRLTCSALLLLFDTAGIVQTDSLLDNQISVGPMMLKKLVCLPSDLFCTIAFYENLQALFRQTLCLTTRSVLSL